MVKVLVKKLDPAVQIPSYKTIGASGMDLMAFIKEPIKLPAKKFNDELKNTTLKMIPYYAWNNRKNSSMIVWIPFIKK